MAKRQKQARGAGREARTLFIASALAIGVIVIYAQCLHHPFIRLDDPDYVIENDHVNSGLSVANIAWAFTALYASNWHPLTWISHMIDVQLFGLDAGKQILVSVLLHAANSILLFIFLRRATRTLWPSAAVAALFAVHPLHVESVAWVSERKDVLSTLFFLITLLLWTQWVQTQTRSRYWWSVIAFAAGLMSKPMLVTTPFVMLLLDWWPFDRKISKALVIEKWPFFGLSVLSSLITLRAQRPAMGASPLGVRLANSIVAYASYIGKTIWPMHLSIVYPFRAEVSIVSAAIAIGFLVLVSAAATYYRRRFPFLIVGWLWYLGTLVPVSGIVQVGHEAMADRYTYIPLIGIFIAIAWLIPNRAMLAVAIAALGVCAFIQVGYWRSGITLFEHALAVVGDNRYVHEGLGTELLKAHAYRRAETEFRAALSQAPHDDELHTGLGSALMQLGDVAGARREFELAIAANPSNATALRRLGDLVMAEGRTDDAVKLYERSVAAKRDPGTLAVLAALQGKTDYAISLYREAIAREPDKPEIRSDLAAVLSRSGRDPEAIVEYEEALRIDPHQYETLMNFGAVLGRLGRNEDAIAQFEQAAQQRPESPEPHVYLALVHARMHRNDDALREAIAANQINPASANLEFSSALHMPPSESNLSGWIAHLRSGAQGRN
ncbi:MAG: tetratricopeptide repeat protein [Acidobacteriota bacterium]|nr:tetratricopeptide repeat protein [Acidobacteriota bacterium]